MNGKAYMSPSDRRRELFSANIERIEYAYEQSLRDGTVEPVIWVMDICDPGARIIAEGLVGKRDVESHLETAKENRVNQCLIYASAKTDSLQATSVLSSYGRIFLSRILPQGVFVVVIISDGGVSWATHSIP